MLAYMQAYCYMWHTSRVIDGKDVTNKVDVI